MDHPRILMQLDSDRHASMFDAVVAIDSLIEHLVQYAEVTPDNVRGLVHGAMFTRGPTHLHNTAIFVGGANVQTGEQIALAVRESFFGPIRVSVMLDSNGANTTAAAAVLCAARHVNLSNITALVLGGTGPVGQRVARLLLGQGAKVRLASRDMARSTATCQALVQHLDAAVESKLQPCAVADDLGLNAALADVQLLFGCGAAGVCLASQEQLAQASQLSVAIDLNAVPPAGLGGIGPTDKAVQRGSRIDYGAIGVGGLKMKIHREAIRSLFSRNDLFLDAEEIFEIGNNLEQAATV